MKKIFFVFVGLLIAQISQAQEGAFGIKIGLATNNLEIEKKQDVLVTTDGIDTTYSYSAGGTKIGFHAGFMGRFTFNKFMIQPELYVSSSNNEYTVSSIPNFGNDKTSKPSQSLVKLDIPILIGYKFAGPFRINAGPVASILLDDNNGLLEVLGNTAEGKSNNVTFGLQGGLGVDISKLTIDLRYETNLSSLGNGITVDGTTYDYDTRTRQISLSLGFLF